jgi:two-component system nitrogen regulation response regulator GlnG
MSASSIISIDDLPNDIFDTEQQINRENSINGSWQTNLEEYIRSNITSDKEVIKKVNVEFEKIIIDESLKATNGIKLEAAKLLGWGRNTLARKAKNI